MCLWLWSAWGVLGDWLLTPEDVVLGSRCTLLECVLLHALLYVFAFVYCRYICMHVCMYVCMYEFMCACLYACMSAFVCTYVYEKVCMYYTCMYVCVYILMYSCIFIHEYADLVVLLVWLCALTWFDTCYAYFSIHTLCFVLTTAYQSRRMCIYATQLMTPTLTTHYPDYQ